MTLPNFFVIGAGKSGTTSLWRYLEQHPEVYMSPIKEPNFFTFEGGAPDFRGPRTPWAVTDLEAYRALFAGVSEEKAIGEASAYYLYSEESPKRIRHHVPEAKLIAILMLRSSKTVHKRSSPMSLRSGRATPHPRFRFAIQLSGRDSCRMRLATSCGGADAGPKSPGPLRPAVLLATRPRSVGAR